MSTEGSEDSGGTVRSRTVCALCRQRKTKCDRIIPRCSFCIKAKAECQYLPRPKKRGLRAGYVAELESRIASLEDQVDDLRQNSSISHVTADPSTSTFNPNLQNTPIVFDGRPTPGAVSCSPDHSRAGIRHISTTGTAIADLQILPRAYFHSLADYWFNENQHWIPILDRNHIQVSLEELPDPIDHIPDVVLRAVVALRMSYSSQAICLGYEGRRKLSLYLRSQVLMEAMATPSIRSAQALLIIALLDYGSDEISSTFSIMAMVRRMGENIGIFKQLLARIQAQSPAQVVPTAGEPLTSDSASIALTWAIVSFDTVAALGVSWKDASSALFDHLTGIAYLNVPDFRDSFRTHIHLTAIGLQPVHEFIVACAKGEHQILEDRTMTLADDLYRNMTSYVQGLPASGYITLADGDIDFDINHVFTRLLSHATIIIVYQRFVSDERGNFELARERCTESYQELIDIVRNLSDADIEVNTPTFAHFLAVAARVKIVLMKTLGQIYDPQLDVLMHGINMCGRRWPLARRLDYTLTMAIMEVTTATPTSLPEDFWDLTKSNLDISEDMKRWLHGRLPYVDARSLALPYV